MAKDNSTFFLKKNIWSEVKDELLGCYLKPYIQKILATRRPLFYVDCFAGKGRFDDGTKGSPLIALEIIDECLKATAMQKAQIESCYIDLNYADDLNRNIAGYNNTHVISGRYEENIEDLLRGKRGYNVFLYIDPYGIKALDCGLFDNFSGYGFNSIEMLINLNSFGFMREACRAMKVAYSDVEAFDELVEYEPSTMDTSDQSIQDLTDIAGGDYWRKIVEDYKSHRIDGYEAERQFSLQYCLRMSQKYKYVLNMPIRLKEGHRPKYRMIHATNHEDGCVLMYENICKRWERLGDIQTGGQMTLFDLSVENEIIDIAAIRAKMEQHMSQYSINTMLSKILAEFYTKYGVLCKPPVIREILQDLEGSEFIIVTRTPETTKAGKPTQFFTENSKQRVQIRRKP